MMISAMQMSYSMPPTGHAANCRCNACLEYKTNPCKAPCSRVDLKNKRPEAEWPTSDENDSNKYKKHHANCECVDCLCLPKIKKIANTKECPIVYDTKQVYQVKVKCDCSNAQNRSRIPISTTTSNPPKVKSEQKDNAEDQNKQAESANNPPLSASESLYNSVACDCPECVCTDCPDGSKRTGGKDCCCKDSCICDPCVIEELAKKLREAEAKLAASYTQPPTQPGGAPQGEHGEDCTCPECACPQAHMLPKKGISHNKYFFRLIYLYSIFRLSLSFVHQQEKMTKNVPVSSAFVHKQMLSKHSRQQVQLVRCANVKSVNVRGVLRYHLLLNNPNQVCKKY